MAISTFHGVIQWSFLCACLLTGLLFSGPARGDQLNILIKGVEEPLLSNIRARTSSFRVSGNTRLSRRRLTRFRADAERRAGSALRPFGYYHAVLTSELRTIADGSWELTLHVDKGPAVIVSGVRVDLLGPGKADPGLQKWKAEWPLTEGSILDQAIWEEQKLAGLDLAHAHGFLSAEFSEQLIKLDLEQNRASLALLLETGEQAVMGSIVFNQDVVQPGVLENLPRFNAGQPYDEWLMEQFRLDLWRTGFFNNIEVLEERKLDESPPVVNLVVNLEPRNPNTYQGSLGFGSDTGVRVQAMWNRHVLSRRGDSLDVGFGWRQRDNEFNFRTFYRYPRKVSARQYWAVELLYKTEDEKFTVSPVGDSEQRTTIARGSVDDYSIKPGWIKIRGLKQGYQQIFEHWYLQYLNERSRYSPVDEVPPEIAGWSLSSVEQDYIDNTSETTSVGVSWDWPVVRGHGFETFGHRHRAWLFTSNTAWGSDLDFSQAYLSSRWNTIWKNRWKLLLRGEVGYSDAHIQERLVEVGDELVSISLTELPSAYRFKAGGSQSVRGYGFETLSDNSIGSNNIITASAELEMLFRKNWSVALFFDVGNAFNDWGQIDLKKGAGVGIRWYSIAGAIRLDIAQALDEPGNPWRLHFTIGSPLL
jgi:translocation and assembly module TamA